MTISTLRRPFPLPFSLAALALASCSSPPVSGLPEAGRLDARDEPRDHAGPPRTATTRPLLATSTRNLLLDPFVTTDTSLGHFLGILLPVLGTHHDYLTLQRAFVSQAPAGVAAPVASLGALVGGTSAATSVQIVAPFTGGSGPVTAQIWVSAGDATGAPVPFDPGGKGLTVSLFPNDLPAHTYPLARDGAPPLVLAGRQWVRFALASPAPMPQGGWFSIAVEDVNASFQLQAPEVAPTAAVGPAPPPPHQGERVARDRAVLGAYVARTRHLR